MFFVRFGGSQSSQSPTASKVCGMTAAEPSDGAAGSDSEEDEPKDDLDPFSSQSQTEAAKSEMCYMCYTVAPRVLQGLCTKKDPK